MRAMGAGPTDGSITRRAIDGDLKQPLKLQIKVVAGAGFVEGFQRVEMPLLMATVSLGLGVVGSSSAPVGDKISILDERRQLTESDSVKFAQNSRHPTMAMG